MWHCPLPLTKDKEGRIVISGSYYCAPLLDNIFCPIETKGILGTMLPLGQQQYLKLHCLYPHI